MIIRRDAIKAVLPAVTTDDTRYALSSILVEPSGVLVATNGHVLLTARDKAVYKDEDFPVTPRRASATGPNVSPEAGVLLDGTKADRLIKAMPKRDTIPILHSVQIGTDDKGPFATATDLEIPVTVDLQVNGGPDAPRFPSWEKVMPKADQPVIRLQLGVPVLEALIKSAKAATTGKVFNGPFITLEIPTDSECYAGKDHGKGLICAIGVRIDGTDVDVIGCAMPVRL